MRFARAYRRRHTPGQMNKLEAAYAERLRIQQAAGEIAEFAFEAVTLKLAADCRLTPDFFVVMPDGVVEFHETKGFMEGDAAVKLRVAADKFPFRFKLVKQRAKRDGGGWEFTDYTRKDGASS